jgi:hypothetical protein
MFGDPKFLEGLKKLKFDIGIGGLSMAETLLFRELELQYIKLSLDDIEAYNMQIKL